MQNSLLTSLIFANCMIMFVLGVLQLSYRRKVSLNYLLTLIYFIMSYNLFYNWAFQSEYIWSWPLLFNTDIVVPYSMAACIALYFKALFDNHALSFKKQSYYFIPAAGMVLFVLVNNSIHPEQVIAYFSTKPHYTPMAYDNFTRILHIIGSIVCMLVFIISIRKIRFMLKNKPLFKSPELLFLLIFFSLMLLNVFLIIWSLFVKNAGILLLARNLAGVLLIIHAVFSNRYPVFLQIVIKESKTPKYEKSKLINLDTHKILNDLNRLMTNNKIYLEDKIKLTSVSRLLKINPQQLSELLNNHYKSSFRSYINAHRIAEVKKLLIKKPTASIMEIAYSAGFSSKSAFHAAFIENVNCSPKEYRKKHIKQG